MAEMLTLEAFEEASKKVREVTLETKLVESPHFSASTGNRVWLKPENMQRTGAYKVRGAYYKISTLSPEELGRGIVTASAGNHAQGVAFAAHSHGIPATIVMPKAAPIAKVQATEGYGARVVLHGDCYDEAYARALEICEAEGATFLHPFDDYEVMAGQGTVALEILSELPTVDTVVVPVGGGGLLSGVAACIKHVNPRVKVIGVQAEGASAVYQSFKAKKRTTTARVSTIADGIAVGSPGEHTVEMILKYADDMVTVTDNEISAAILLLMERTKQIVEPSGASSLAAVLSGKVDAHDKRTVCLLSGGNIDVSFIHRVIDQGLVTRHRRMRFTTRMPDAPGRLIEVLQVLADSGANVLEINHDRFSRILGPNEILVHVACEVGGEEHGKNVMEALKKAGYNAKIDAE